MAHKVDFAVLKTQTDITKVLAVLGITHLTTHKEQLRGTCPICKASNPRGFIVTPEKGTWYCFGEKRGGDLIRLASAYWNVDDRNAALRLATELGVLDGAGTADSNASPSTEPEASRKQSGFDPRAYQLSLVPDHEALTGLGISPQTIQQLGGGFAPKGIMRGRLALPIQRGDDILGFLGLALKGETPEVLFPKDFHVPYFFNMQNVREGTLTMVQDVPALLHAMDNGMENLLCPLQPISVLSLVCLSGLMKERNCNELEFFG